MKLLVYLDESGNSGDAIPKNLSDPFSGQPSFALAGVGFPENSDLDCWLQELREKYKIQSKELKASQVFNKPQFLEELLQTIIESKYPLFVELMDKSYFIAVNICTYYLLRNLDIVPYHLFPGRYVAGQIADCFNQDVLMHYSQLCFHPTIENFIRFSVSLYHGCHLEVNKHNEYSIFFSGLLMILEEDILRARSGDFDESEIKKFIPLPDYSKRNKAILMLPHVSAFANLYARINYVVPEHIDIDVIHDEQAQFDEILTLWEESLTSNKWSDTLMGNQARHPAANYVFKERFSLQFAQSHTCYGIQVADVVAGFCTRYFNAAQANQVNKKTSYCRTIKLLEDLSNRGDGQGINIVASPTSISKFYSMT